MLNKDKSKADWLPKFTIIILCICICSLISFELAENAGYFISYGDNQVNDFSDYSDHEDDLFLSGLFDAFPKALSLHDHQIAFLIVKSLSPSPLLPPPKSY